MILWISLYRAGPPGPGTLDITHGTPPPAPVRIWTPDTELPNPLLVKSGGHHWRPVQTCSLEDPPVLTSGGHSTYGWQAAGMHSTGMLLQLYF